MNWKIGKIKFYSEEKKFGYLIDGTGHWDDKEYRFDNNLVSNYIFKNDDFVCVKFEKKENKKIVKSIKLVDRFFFDEYFEELDKYFRYELIEYLDKNTKKQIDELAETYRGNLDEIKKNLTFKEEKINIEEYLEDFRIELKIFKNNKPGDDAFINILYKISHPKFEYIPLSDFKTNILSHHGLIDIFEIEKDFVEKEQENYLTLMPIFFNDFKNSLKKKLLHK